MACLSSGVKIQQGHIHLPAGCLEAGMKANKERMVRSNLEYMLLCLHPINILQKNICQRLVFKSHIQNLKWNLHAWHICEKYVRFVFSWFSNNTDYGITGGSNSIDRSQLWKHLCSFPSQQIANWITIILWVKRQGKPPWLGLFLACHPCSRAWFRSWQSKQILFDAGLVPSIGMDGIKVTMHVQACISLEEYILNAGQSPIFSSTSTCV